MTLARTLHRLRREKANAWHDRSLWDQLLRAAVSVPANIAEGASRASPREFAHFLSIAAGSTAELHTLLDLAVAGGLLSHEDGRFAIAEAIAVHRMCAALRARVNTIAARHG
ncbi:MAG: four helix bundle protein [Gemmatimonadaceae bacterium]|nr:four helix bundle protein [Gemmatimonadaceae bacterium]